MIDVILKALPGIAGTALGGPIGGILAGQAAGWIAKKLGVQEDDSQAIQDAIAGMDPLERMKLENEFQRWIIEEQNRVYFKELDDLKSARERDAEFLKANTRNWRADILTTAAIAGVAWLVYLIWNSPDIPEFLKGIFTLVMGRLLGYVDQIFAFEFGTTRTSRTKDNTIEQLTKK